MQIDGKNLLEVWKKSIFALLSLDTLVPTDRNLDTYEYANMVLNVTEPLKNLDELRSFEEQRNIDYSSASIRTYWDNVENRVKKYYRSSRSTINQLDEVTSKLHDNPYTRHGYISIWSPFTDLKDSYPTCLIGLYFIIRNDKLNMTAIMRSNDSWGQALNDMYELVAIQKKVADELKIKVGTYSHFAMSYHLYTKDKINAMMVLGKES